ncbi:MAG TPA: carbon-nitrogen hydrolase family protein [Anaerolineales bacterium]|nr:carbon-nitrogen hydrolase family protein [Anaerolineales bacterium]
MPRTIKVATVQMDAMPAPLTERLARAEKIITKAAQAGAQLVVLPELFNTGYAYSDDNFERAETLEGLTSTWMKTLSERVSIHLAGAILLLDGGEIYDTMLLFSPSGQRWRYDKNYPWAWERAYFRGRRGMTVAKTELGDLGLMICWDVGHVDIWKQYAGKADMIVISSCPPDGSAASFEFPNNEKLEMNDLETMSSIKDVGKTFFGQMVDQQAKWLGIPAVNSGASGQVRTHLPRARALLTSLALFAPRILNFLSQAKSLEMSCEMIPSCKVVGASGNILAARTPNEGEGFVISEVTLTDSKPVPATKQPYPPLPRSTARMAFFNADVMVPFLMRSVYKNGLKKVKAITHQASAQSIFSK